MKNNTILKGDGVIFILPKNIEKLLLKYQNEVAEEISSIN